MALPPSRGPERSKLSAGAGRAGRRAGGPSWRAELSPRAPGPGPGPCAETPHFTLQSPGLLSGSRAFGAPAARCLSLPGPRSVGRAAPGSPRPARVLPESCPARPGPRARSCQKRPAGRRGVARRTPPLFVSRALLQLFSPPRDPRATRGFGGRPGHLASLPSTCTEVALSELRGKGLHGLGPTSSGRRARAPRPRPSRDAPFVPPSVRLGVPATLREPSHEAGPAPGSPLPAPRSGRRSPPSAGRPPCFWASARRPARPRVLLRRLGCGVPEGGPPSTYLSPRSPPELAVHQVSSSGLRRPI